MHEHVGVWECPDFLVDAHIHRYLFYHLLLIPRHGYILVVLCPCGQLCLVIDGMVRLL